MTTNASEVLRSFDTLSEAEKHQVALQVFRWWRQADIPALTDDELSAAADAVFTQLDQEETERG